MSCVLLTEGTILLELNAIRSVLLVFHVVIVALFALGASQAHLCTGGVCHLYKAGWPVSTGFIVQSAFMAAALLIVGYFVYREALTWNKIVGVVICLIGLGFINYK